MSWDPINDPIDYVILAGKRSPGIADIIGASSPRRWDERRGYGLSGATLIFRGVQLAKWTLQLRLYTPEDWADWHAWKRLVQRPPAGARPKAMDIWHPILEELGVKAAGVEDLLQPLQTADGEWTIEIKMIEYRRPEFKLAKPEGAKENEAVDPIDALIDQNRREIEDLNRQIADERLRAALAGS
jgi:hypothetical protein